MLRTVHREQIVALAAGRALLMMAAHPVVFEGFFAATQAKDDPFKRLERTAEVLMAISYGPKADADRAAKAVRTMHSTVEGELPFDAGRFPAGTPYRADDPKLLFWVWGSLVDSALLVYERYVRVLSAGERQAYWDDQRLVAELFGIPLSEMPETIEGLRAYVAGMIESGDLFVTPDALAVGKDIILSPPLPTALRPLVEVSNQISIGMLPGQIRKLYGFSWDPVRGLIVRAGQEYMRRLVVPFTPSLVRYTPQWRSRGDLAA
jgi:uncharacterized protein (DUF2236 family)